MLMNRTNLQHSFERVLYILWLTISFTLSGCDENVSTEIEEDLLEESDSSGADFELEIQPTKASVIPGERIALQATAILVYGERINVAKEGIWKSENEEILILQSLEGEEDTIPKAKALKTGETKIHFTYKEKELTIPVTVLEREIKGLIASADTIEIKLAQKNGKGIPKEFSLDIIGIYSDEATENFNDKVEWSITRETPATISSIDEASTDSETNEQASMDQESANNASDSEEELTKTNDSANNSSTDTTSSTEIEESAEAQETTEPQESAENEQATESDESKETVAQDTSEPTVEEVKPAKSSLVIPLEGNPGKFSAIAPGKLFIKGTHGGFGVSTSVQISIEDRVPVAVSTVPPTLFIPTGRNNKFRAKLIYSDESIEGIDSISQIINSDETLLTVGESEKDENGIVWYPVTANIMGEGQLTLKHEGIEKILTVKSIDGVPDHLEVKTPNGTKVAIGDWLQMYVKLIYSDGTVQDITEQAFWEVENPALAKFSKDVLLLGQVTGRKTGETKVSVTWGDLVASAELEVFDAKAKEIEVESAGFGPLPKGDTRQFDATVLYTDEIEIQANDLVTWSIINGTGTATISPTGLVTAGEPGTAKVKAEIQGVSHEIDLTVGVAVISHLQIEIANTELSRAASPHQLQAFLVSTDGTKIDKTWEAEWTYDMHSDGYTQVGYIDNSGTKGETVLNRGQNGNFLAIAHVDGYRAELELRVID